MQTIPQTPVQPTITAAEQTALMTAMLRLLDAIRPASAFDATNTTRIIPLPDGMELAHVGDEYHNDVLHLRRVSSPLRVIATVSRMYTFPGGALREDQAAAAGKVDAIVAAIDAVLNGERHPRDGEANDA